MEHVGPELLEQLRQERERISSSIQVLEDSRRLLDGALSGPMVNSVTDAR